MRDHIKNRKQFYVKTWNKLKSQLAIMSIGATEAVALSTIPGLEQFKGLVAVAFLVTLSEVIWTFWSTIVNDYTKIEEEKREILAELKSLQFHNFVLNKLNEWPDFFETLPDVIEKIEQKERQKMDEWLTAAQDRLVVGEDGELVDPLGENFDDFTQQTTS